jgi:hypothetical protein
MVSSIDLSTQRALPWMTVAMVYYFWLLEVHEHPVSPSYKMSTVRVVADQIWWQVIHEGLVRG